MIAILHCLDEVSVALLLFSVTDLIEPVDVIGEEVDNLACGGLSHG